MYVELCLQLNTIIPAFTNKDTLYRVLLKKKGGGGGGGGGSTLNSAILVESGVFFSSRIRE